MSAIIARGAIPIFLMLVLLVPTLTVQADAPFAECFPSNAIEDNWLAYTIVDGEIDPESASPIGTDNKAFWFGLDGDPLIWLGDGSDIPEAKEHIFGMNLGFRGMPSNAQRVGMLASQDAAVWIFLAPDNGNSLWLVLFTKDGMCGGFHVDLSYLEESDADEQGFHKTSDFVF